MNSTDVDMYEIGGSLLAICIMGLCGYIALVLA